MPPLPVACRARERGGRAGRCRRATGTTSRMELRRSPSRAAVARTASRSGPLSWPAGPMMTNGSPAALRLLDASGALDRGEHLRRSGVAARVQALEADLHADGVLAELVGELRNGPDADQLACREDAHAIAHRLDLREQVAREEDRQAALADQRPQAGRGSPRRRSDRWPSSARRGSEPTGPSPAHRRCRAAGACPASTSRRGCRHGRPCPTCSSTWPILSSASPPHIPLRRAV